VGLPDSLPLKGLKRRVDKQLSTDDDLLEEFLEGAFEQAQAPAPCGCGRLLTPDPPFTDAEPPEDTNAPVQKTFEVPGRRVLIPDARAITEVLVDDEAVTGYHTVQKDGHVVALTVPHDPGCRAYGHITGSTGCESWCARRRRVVKVTGRFGFVEIPMNLRDAIYILAARSYLERDAQYADQVALPDGGGVQAYYRQLPPRTKLVFATYAPAQGLAGLA